MSNSRTFRPGRTAARHSLKQQVRARDIELARQRGINLALQAQLSATKMERPPDLEEWINEVALPDMSDDERAQWDALDDAGRESFMDQLGQKINVSRALLAVDADGAGSPSASAAGS